MKEDEVLGEGHVQRVHHPMGNTRKQARDLSIKNGIHYVIFDEWAKTVSWGKKR